MSRIVLLLCLLSFLPMAPAFAEERSGILRERIKERLREKLDQPAPGGGSASVKAPITKPGDYSYTISHDGLERRYRVHVPASYQPARAMPVVVALHGGGGDMDYIAKDEYYRLISKSEESGYVVVFPSGYSKFRSGKLATWNAGTCCGDARDQAVDDVGFIRAIIGNLKTQMKIDAGRIYATGMSNGGMMSYRLACEAADIFAAVAPVAGTDNTLTCQPSRPVSVLHIHAVNDTHVLFEGGAGDDAFRDKSKVSEFTSVASSTSRWVAHDSCNPRPRRVLTTDGAYCDLYTGCAGGTQVKLCVTERGGHSWPGGYKPRGDEQPSQAINANDMMWDFFESLQ